MLQASNRFFAFGCSLTRCTYPTWADILGREFDHYENWGRGGSGNQFIFHSLIECHKRNNFTSSDTVIVQWATTLREDRYVDKKGGWIGGGTLQNQQIYPKSWINEYSCTDGYLIRDLSLIHAAYELLTKWGVKFEFHAPVLITPTSDNPIIKLYQDTLDKCRPNIVKTIWSPNDTVQQWVSLWPISEKSKTFYWETAYNELAGADWPLFVDFISGNYTSSKSIQRELDLFVKNYGGSLTHPTPQEHLEYLDRVFPEFEISSNTREWVDGLRRNPSEEINYYNSNVPQRFNVNL